jgi:hypothetical protein
MHHPTGGHNQVWESAHYDQRVQHRLNQMGGLRKAQRSHKER